MSLIRRFNRIPSVYPAAAVTVIYTALIIFTACFHELWFDEAQAWTIARDVPVADILLKLPHYETPPPLWQLMLVIPAKAGLPYELSMKVIQIVTAVFMISVFEFRSPFPNIIKVILPFTYWMAYQYGIIARPYALIAAFLFICASLYPERDKKPVIYCIFLALLCFISLFGLVFAAMIAAAWIFELILKYRGEFFKRFFASDRARLFSLAALLVFGLLTLVLSWPKSDDASSVFSGMASGALGRSILNAVFVLPSETFFTTELYPNLALSTFELDPGTMAMMAFRSVLIYVLIMVLPAMKKRLIDCILPLAGFLFLSGAYSMAHHFGLFFVLAVYFIWIGLYKREDKPEKDGRMAEGLVTAAFIYAMMFPLVWTVMSVRGEILYPYDYGKDLALWITENNVSEYKWISAWEPVNVTYAGELLRTTSAYLGKPVNYNLHKGMTFTFRDTSDPGSAAEDFSNWSKYGSPDYIVAYRRSQFESNLQAMGVSGDYVLVCVKQGGNIDRGRFINNAVGVWMNRDNKKLPPVNVQTEVPEGFVLED